MAYLYTAKPKVLKTRPKAVPESAKLVDVVNHNGRVIKRLWVSGQHPNIGRWGCTGKDAGYLKQDIYDALRRFRSKGEFLPPPAKKPIKKRVAAKIEGVKDGLWDRAADFDPLPVGFLSGASAEEIQRLLRDGHPEVLALYS